MDTLTMKLIGVYLAAHRLVLHESLVLVLLF